MSLVPIREYTDPALMMAAYAALKRRLSGLAAIAPPQAPEPCRGDHLAPGKVEGSLPLRRMWDLGEVGALRRMVEAGEHKKSVAAALQRSVTSVECKAWSLGLSFICAAPPEPPPKPEGRDWLRLSVPFEEARKVKAALVIAVVAEVTDVRAHEIMGQSRVAPVTRARQIACLLLRRHTTLSLGQIAIQLGNRDHTSVLHGIRNMEAKCAEDVALANMIASITSEINARAPEPISDVPPLSLEAA
jgi:hypothetical protein